MIPFVVQATPATQQLGAWTIGARATYVQVYSHCGAGICQGEMLGPALGRSAAQRPGGELRVSGGRRGRLTETCPGTVPGHVSWDDFLGVGSLHLRSLARDAASLAADRTLDFGVPLT